MQLHVTVPYEENHKVVEDYVQKLEKVDKLNLDIQFYRSIVPPHRYDITIDGITPAQVEEIKKEFREIMKNTRYKNVCNFKVTEE